jgi:hypothetical protein
MKRASAISGTIILFVSIVFVFQNCSSKGGTAGPSSGPSPSGGPTSWACKSAPGEISLQGNSTATGVSSVQDCESLAESNASATCIAVFSYTASTQTCDYECYTQPANDLITVSSSADSYGSCVQNSTAGGVSCPMYVAMDFTAGCAEQTTPPQAISPISLGTPTSVDACATLCAAQGSGTLCKYTPTTGASGGSCAYCPAGTLFWGPPPATPSVPTTFVGACK